MSEARTVDVTLLAVERWAGDWPPEAPDDFLAWWRDKIAQIPEEHRASARIEIASESDYDDDHHACLKISYSRPETDDERVGRLREEKKQLAWRLERDRAQYEELRRKFEGIDRWSAARCSSRANGAGSGSSSRTRGGG